MTSQLSSCSTDVQRAIFEHLSFAHLMRMRLTGCRRIMRAIFSVTRIRHDIEGNDGLLRIPNLSQFPILEDFAATYDFIPVLRRSDSSISWKNLPNTLTSLKLDFMDSADGLRSSPDSNFINIHDQFPNLQDLRLHMANGSESRIAHLISVLPRNLLKFALTSGNIVSMDMSNGRILEFPPTLTLLDIPFVELNSLPQEREGVRDLATDAEDEVGGSPHPKGIWLPETLTFLVIATKQTRELQLHLPEQLLHLHVINQSQDTDSSDSWAKLPRELISLSTSTTTCTAERIASLPRTLLHFTLLSTTTLSDIEIIQQLPPNLKTFQADVFPQDKTPEFLEKFYRALPRSLTGSLRIPIKSEVLSVLPSHWQELALYGEPMTTEQLDLALLFSSPRYLSKLTITYLNDEIAELLPRTLTELSHFRGQISAVGAEHLPSLKKLTTWSRGLKDDACVASLPQSLRSLNWGIRDPVETQLSISEQVLGLLPRDLEQLVLSIDRFLNDDWMAPLQRLTSLTVLRLGSPLSAPVLTSLTSAHLLRLPPSLTRCATIVSGVLHEDHLFQLPKRLLALDITAHNSFCGLSNEGVKKLPRSLFVLKLPSLPFLTGWCSADLPPRLSTFTAGSDAPLWWTGPKA